MGECQAQRPTGHSQNDGLNQELPNQPPPTGPHGLAQGNLSSPGAHTSQRQGSQSSMALNGKLKFSGRIPTTVWCMPSRRMVWPTTPGSPP